MRPPDTDPTSLLVRDVARFQLKLWMEAGRDLVLIPVSLIAAALDLVLSKQQKPRFFRQIIEAGRRSDDWIDLWSTQDVGKPVENVDAVMARVERLLRDPKTGARQARALKRWVELTMARQRRTASAAVTESGAPPPQPPGPPPPPGVG
jgi:hypothetical protein